MPGYSKGNTFIIVDTIGDNIYVGSAIKTLSQRMANHRSRIKARPQYSLYKHMRESGAEHYYIEPIELRMILTN